jgi:hypothetical protein
MEEAVEEEVNLEKKEDTEEIKVLVLHSRNKKILNQLGVTQLLVIHPPITTIMHGASLTIREPLDKLIPTLLVEKVDGEARLLKELISETQVGMQQITVDSTTTTEEIPHPDL